MLVTKFWGKLYPQKKLGAQKILCSTIFLGETKFVAQQIVSSITFEVSKKFLGQNKLWVNKNVEKKDV